MNKAAMNLAKIQEHARQTVFARYKLAFSVGGAVRAAGNTFKTLGGAASVAGNSFKNLHGLNFVEAGKINPYSTTRNLANSASIFHNQGGTKALGQIAAGTAVAGAGAYGAKRLLSGNEQPKPQATRQYWGPGPGPQF